jgi:adenosylcobinamide-GDP ribazoletransferase
MRGLITAVAFLTRLPVSPSWQPHEESDFKYASWYFPLIGLLLGFIAVGIFSLLQRFLPGSLTLLLTLGAGLLLTGALHEDGFADVADACGGATLERRLEIMKDSRLGSYGVMALIFMFGFKFFAWQSLDIVANKRLLAVLLLGPAWSRWIFLPLMSMVPGQAGRNGLGRFFAAPPWWWIGASGLILALLTWKMMPEKTAPLIVAVLSAGAGLGWFFRRWFGGMTGDCFGAAAVWTELSLLLAVNWGLG